MPFFIFLELSPREFLFPAILLSRRHSSADMPLGFVVFQNPPNLPVQLGIYAAQTLGNVFMHRTLADAELFGGFPHGGFVFQNIIAKLYGPFFYDALQIDPPTTVLFHLYVGKACCRTSIPRRDAKVVSGTPHPCTQHKGLITLCALPGEADRSKMVSDSFLVF